MKVKSYAKINLALDVVKKPQTKDGYHEIRTIFQQINLHDVITFKKRADLKFHLTCNNKNVPCSQKNTILKALQLLKKEAQKFGKMKYVCGFSICIQKNIPVSSGLGGGSSNAATALIAANKLWKLKFSIQKLAVIAAKIGMDAPFFLYGGMALGTHYGEKIKPLLPFKKLHILLLCNQTKKNTGKMYQALSSLPTNKNAQKTKQLLAKIHQKINNRAVLDLFHNDFQILFKNSPFQQELIAFGASTIQLSGAGPTWYAIFDQIKNQQKAYQFLKKRVSFVTKTHTICSNIIL